MPTPETSASLSQPAIAEQTLAGSLHYALDERAIAHATQAERFRVFNERCIVGATNAFAGIGLLTWVIWAAAGATAALAWALLMSLVEAAILVVGLRCRPARADPARQDFWLKVHTALAGAGGVAWGSAAWFVWTPGQIAPYLATLTILVGVAGVSMVTMASYAKPSVLFFMGLYLMPLLHVALHPSPVAKFMEAGLVVGLLVQLSYTRELGKVVLRDVEQYARNAALVERLHKLVIHDPLTGACSRSHTFEQMERLVSARDRHGTCASMIMFDLDHFKAINDTHGHPAGDRALREVVRAVSGQLRDGDLLGRIGGEEFVVLLPMTDMAAAGLLAERLRQTLAATSIVEGSHSIHLPASFGIAELGPSENQADWIRRVDDALYRAKDQGRNAVVAVD